MIVVHEVTECSWQYEQAWTIEVTRTDMPTRGPAPVSAIPDDIRAALIEWLADE